LRLREGLSDYGESGESYHLSGHQYDGHVGPLLTRTIGQFEAIHDRYLNISDEHGYSLARSDLLQAFHGAVNADSLTAQFGQHVAQHVEKKGFVVDDKHNTRHLPATSINGRMMPPQRAYRSGLPHADSA
jgi:hypothetical protein